MIEREEACLRSWGVRLAAGRHRDKFSRSV